MFKTIQITAVLFSLLAFTQCSSQNKPKDMHSNTDTQNLTKQIVVDVRSKEEWNFDGHANCSVNIPLDELEARKDELKGYDKIVLVCRSGNRAGIAKGMLQKAGYGNIENLGPWQNVKCAN